MKFSVLLSEISKQLVEVAGIAGSSNNKDDITQNIYIGVNDHLLTLKATNYLLELKTEISLTDVESDGEITVNSNKLKETLSSLDPNSIVTFYLDESSNILRLTSEDSTQFEIRTQSAIDFPSFEIENVEQTIVLKQKQLKTIIDTSSFCVSTEDFRDYLKGVRIELNGNKLEVFTSDGHRMCILETNLENQQPTTSPFGAIITKRCADQLSKIVSEGSDSEVVLQFTKNAVLTQCNHYSLASKLINCGYPNVRSVIPKQIDTIISVPKQDCINALKKASVLSSKRVNGVTFTFGNGELLLNSENSEHERSQARISLPEAQTPIEISLNAKYVKDVISVIKSDNVRFCFSQPLIHVLIKPETDINENDIISSYIISKVVV